jgi:hypothetical protein
LGQFLPCAAQLNRLLSYSEKAVCTTTALLQHDKRLFAQSTTIAQDEMPVLMEQQIIGWKEFQEARAATDYWIGSLKFQIGQLPNTTENEKQRNELQQSIVSIQKVMTFYRFLYRHFLDVMADEAPMNSKNFGDWLVTKKVQRKIILPFLKSIRAQKVQHEALFEQPYYPSAESSKKIVPTVFAKHLALALEHGSLFFIEGPGGIADRKILLYFPIAFGEELKMSHRGEMKKCIEIYTATPDMVLIEMSKGVSENFAEDFVHLVLRPLNHTKTALRRDPVTSLQNAQRVLQAYWDQGLRVAMVVAKEMAPALRAWAKQYRPDHENLIGWIGKHHISHNDWANCDGLVIWSLDLPPVDVLAREYLATRRIFGRTAWADLDEFDNHWDSSRKDYVAFPHLGKEVLARVFANPDFDRFVRWRVSQIITQAVGRLRGVNNPNGETRKKFCDVYSEIPPIDGLFGTYIDDIIPAEFQSPEALHKQAVERLANVMSCYHLSLPATVETVYTVAQAELLPPQKMQKKTIRMSIRDLQKTVKTHGLSGFQSENLREALELLKQSRPDVLDYKIRPGKSTEIIVRTDLPIPAPEQPTDDRVFTLLGYMIQQRQDAGGGEIQFNARELYRILEPQAIQTPGVLNMQTVFSRLQQAFPGIDVEERTVNEGIEPWTYIRFRPDTPAQVLGNAGNTTVGGVYNNSVPHEHDPASVTPSKMHRNGDALTLQIQGTRVKAFSGLQAAPGSLPGDPEPSRVFPAFVAGDFLKRLLQCEGQWHRAGGGEITPEIVQGFEQRFGLDYRKQWVHWFCVPEHPVIETLAILTNRVDSYLTLQHPECLSVLPALDAAERELAYRLAEDPLLQALIDDWRDHPGFPRLDLTKPLHITSSLFRSHQAENMSSG